LHPFLRAKPATAFTAS